VTQAYRPNITEIRLKLGQFQSGTQEKDFAPCEGIPQGVPRGVLCDITGPARTEWILKFLINNKTLNTFWAEEQLTLFPTALQQRGIDLNKILMVETDKNLFKALRKALKSKLFDCIVLPGSIHDTKMLKALQLFARESNAFVFSLSKETKTAWSIPFQIEAEWAPNQRNLVVHVLKSKFSSSSTELLGISETIGA
jgi:hypothetical protein